MNLHVYLLVILLIFSLARLGCPRLSPSWSCAVQSRGLGAHDAPSSAQAAHPRRLPRLSTCLHWLVGCRTSTCSCAPLVRGEKLPGSSEAYTHRRLRLSQPAVHILRQH
jgi:hypothetical protein